MAGLPAELPPDLEQYIEQNNLNKFFETMIKHILYTNTNGRLPLSESHLRVELMRFLIQRHTTRELSNVGIELKRGTLGVPELDSKKFAEPRALTREYKRFLSQVESDIAAEAEVETTRRDLFLSYEDVEELSETFCKFDEDQLGVLNLDALERACRYQFRNGGNTLLSTIHSYFETVNKYEDYQFLKFPDFLRLCHAMDAEKTAEFACKKGFTREILQTLKNFYIDATGGVQGAGDLSVLWRKNINPAVAAVILRNMGHGPSQKALANHFRKINQKPMDGISDPGRVDFRELILVMSEDIDQEAQACRKWGFSAEDQATHREVYDKCVSRETGYLEKSQIKIALLYLQISLTEQDIESLFSQAMEDPFLHMVTGRTKDQPAPDQLDFIEFLCLVQRQNSPLAK